MQNEVLTINLFTVINKMTIEMNQWQSLGLKRRVKRKQVFDFKKCIIRKIITMKRWFHFNMVIENNSLNILVKHCMHRKLYRMLKGLCSCVKQLNSIHGNWITVQLLLCGVAVVLFEGLSFFFLCFGFSSIVYLLIFVFYIFIKVSFWEI